MNPSVRTMLTVILMAILITGCSSGSAGGQSGAQFRDLAKGIYSWLDNPSCSAPPGFDRHARLQREIEAMEEFRHEIDGTLASQQLVLARQDASYEQKVDRRCWADDDIRFAEKHLEMAKNALRDGLPKLRHLSRYLQGPEIDRLTEPHNRADFRYFSKRLITSSRNLCSIATGGRDDQILSSARREIDHFRQSLDDGPFAIQFQISEQDVDYYLKNVVVECADPSNESTTKLASKALSGARDAISEARKTMN